MNIKINVDEVHKRIMDRINPDMEMEKIVHIAIYETSKAFKENTMDLLPKVLRKFVTE